MASVVVVVLVVDGLVVVLGTVVDIAILVSAAGVECVDGNCGKGTGDGLGLNG